MIRKRIARLVLISGLLGTCGCEAARQATEERQLFLPVVANRRQEPDPKRGLGTHHPEFCEDARVLGASWQYNWRVDLGDCAGIEDVPMVYCWSDVGRIEEGLAQIGGDFGWLLGFNEPDIRQQCNLSPVEAARWWPRVEALARGRRMVSPAVVHPEWLRTFRAEYARLYGRPPRMDALAVHCYVNTASGCQALAEEVIGYAREWGVGEVWVTEFSFFTQEGGLGKAEQEARSFMEWMEAEPMIGRYAWFPTRLDGSEYWRPNTFWLDQVLVDWSGSLTTWGELYFMVGR